MIQKIIPKEIEEKLRSLVLEAYSHPANIKMYRREYVCLRTRTIGGDKAIVRRLFELCLDSENFELTLPQEHVRCIYDALEEEGFTTRGRRDLVLVTRQSDNDF